MRRRNLIHSVQSLQTYSPIAKGLSNKKNRISQLSKYYKNGTIWHLQSCPNIKVLEGELLSHPFSKWDDAADALSMLIPMIFPPQERKESKIPKFMVEMQQEVDKISGY